LDQDEIWQDCSSSEYTLIGGVMSDFRHDFILSTCLLLQAKQNYDRELLLHATDIENLAQVKQEVSNKINESVIIFCAIYLCPTVLVCRLI